jgi:hypothetical protein
MIRFISRIRTGLNPFQRRLGLGMSLVLLTVLLMTGCSDQEDIGPSNAPKSSPSPQSKVVNKEGNYITATPNPVPRGGLTGKTMISWSSQGFPGLDVHVFIFDPTGKEVGLFATGSVGSQEAPWISAPTEFRLYAGGGPNRKMLDTVTVTLEGAK